jgi:hypothetical protein
MAKAYVAHGYFPPDRQIAGNRWEKTMKHTICSILRTTVLAWGLASAPAFATTPTLNENSRCDAEARVDRLTEDRPLSARQRVAVQAIVERNLPRRLYLCALIEDNQVKLRGLEAGVSPDGDEARILADVQAKAMAEMALLRAAERAEVASMVARVQSQPADPSPDGTPSTDAVAQAGGSTASDELLALVHRLQRIDGSPLLPFRLN